MKPVRILLPINQPGTTEACANAAFSLAARFGVSLEALLPCPVPAQRVPYSTELSPFYFEELIDVGKKQVALEKRHAKKWLHQAAKAFPRSRRSPRRGRAHCTGGSHAGKARGPRRAAEHPR